MSCCGHVLHVELLVPGGNYKERFQKKNNSFLKLRVIPLPRNIKIPIILTITDRTYVSKEAIFIKISMYPLKNV